MPAARTLDGLAVPALPDSLVRRRILFVAGLSIALSGIASARFEIAGLSFQPVLIPVAVLAALVGGSAYARIPRTIRFTLLLFVGIYCVSSILGGPSVVPLVKIAVLPFIVIVVGGSIESEDDGRAAALGFALAMGIVSAYAVAFGEVTVKGVNPFSGTTNDNGFSVYSLPALLVAGYYVLERATPFRSRILFAAASAAIVVATFTTPNRSGYLGVVVVVVLLLARGRRGRDVMILVALGSILYIGFTTFGDTTAIDYEFDNSNDNQSDFDRRRELFDTAVDVGLANPVLGVGIQRVPSEIGWRLYESGRAQSPFIDAHNVLGDMIAGGGILLSVCFASVVAALWMRPREWLAAGAALPDEKTTRGLLRIMVVLLLTRGLFTGAVLTTPGFAFGLALALGLMVAHRPRASLDPVEPQPTSTGRAAQYGPRSLSRPAKTPNHLSRFDHPRRLVSFDPWDPTSGEPRPT